MAKNIRSFEVKCPCDWENRKPEKVRQSFACCDSNWINSKIEEKKIVLNKNKIKWEKKIF